MSTITQKKFKSGFKEISTDPLVSIGLPIYNGQAFVARALDSLLAQKYPRFEIIISDNASTDRTFEICQSYAEKHCQIKLYRQASNMGVLKNFSSVLKHSSGEYFFWAGMDDLWHPQFTRALVDELEANPKASLAMSGFDRVYYDGQKRDRHRFLGKNCPNDKSYLQTLMISTAQLKFNLFLYGVFRIDFIRAAVGSLPQIPAWDRVFMTTVALATPIRYVDKILHEHGLSSVPVKERYPEEAVFKKSGSEYRNILWNTVGAMFRTAFQTKVIPWYRKPLFFFGAFNFILQAGRRQERFLWKQNISSNVKRFKEKVLDPPKEAWRNLFRKAIDQTQAAYDQTPEAQLWTRRWLKLKLRFFKLFWYAGKAVKNIFRWCWKRLIKREKKLPRGISKP